VSHLIVNPPEVKRMKLTLQVQSNFFCYT